MNARTTISDMNQMMHYPAGQLTVAEQRIARLEQKVEALQSLWASETRPDARGQLNRYRQGSLKGSFSSRQSSVAGSDVICYI
jgi:hypothetical protein